MREGRALNDDTWRVPSLAFMRELKFQMLAANRRNVGGNPTMLFARPRTPRIPHGGPAGDVFVDQALAVVEKK